jgi:iodotyrosine deiodinase
MMPTSSHASAVLLASSIIALAAIWWYVWPDGKCAAEDNGEEFEAGQCQPSPSDPNPSHVPYRHQRLPTEQIRRRSLKLLRTCEQRRTLRFFSSDPVPQDVINTLLMTACTAPSGAHKQPWTFVAISQRDIKQKIRAMVEREETINYQSRMRKSWVEDLKPMVDKLHNNRTDAIQKPYLTEAPWLIAVFKQTHGGVDPETGKRIDHYYVQESVGIACGMLITAITNANLVTLTSTPMGAEKGIRELLERPDHEKLYLLLPVGFPATDATIPYRMPERKDPSKTIIYR